MFNQARSVGAIDKHILVAQFSDGKVKRYDLNGIVDRYPIFKRLINNQSLFKRVKLSPGGFGIIWNDDIDIDSTEVYENGEDIESPFAGMISFKDATDRWGLNESTLRKAVVIGKLVCGVDVAKFGKQWVITMDAMKREYGEPKDF